MANKKLGFIFLYRSLQEHWLWKTGEPFDVRSAWIDLLMSVNHKEGKINIKGRIQIIKPGQKWTSYRTLANHWNWSKDRVKRYLKMLKSDGMIQTDETRYGTLLTIVNWNDFELLKDTDKYANKYTDKDTSKDTDKDTDKDVTINKELNNDKELKKEGRAPAPPSGGGQWQ